MKKRTVILFRILDIVIVQVRISTAEEIEEKCYIYKFVDERKRENDY